MDLIGELLRSSLLSELGDDETRVGKLRSAAEGMASAFSGERRPLVPAAVLSIFDEHTSADSTVLAAADAQLLDQWVTFRAAFPDVPTEMLRAVVAAGIEGAAADERAVLLAAWYTARTAAERLGSGRWAALLAQWVESWRSTVDAAVAEAWVPRVEAVTVRMPPLQPTTEKAITLDWKAFREQVAALDKTNYSTYYTELSERLPQLLESVIAGAQTVGAVAQQRAVAQVKDFAEALGSRLRDALGAQQQAVSAMQLRTDLLWWRQSRFSDRLGRGYDEMSAADVVLAAALDLHLRVPVVAPLSVEHVLADLVATAGGGPVRLADLTASEHAAALPGGDAVSPATLLAAIRDGVPTPVLAEKDDVTPARAAMLVFRDLQAWRLAAAPPPPPPSPPPAADEAQ